MKNWIDIFKGGQQIDSAGKSHDGDALIDRAINKFTNEHTPPIVVGHPKDNAPAYGWVTGLRERVRSGSRFLQAKFDQVNPAFAAAVKNGSYKKRSAAFYPDGSLRHVGFLGASPPAVKGLEDIKFMEQEHHTFNFNEKERGVKMDFKEFIEAVKFWKQTEGGVIPDVPTQPACYSKAFSEADIDALKKAAVDKAVAKVKQQVESEFAEKEKEAARMKAGQAKQIKDFLQKKIDDKVIPPAWVAQGLGAFMSKLDSAAKAEFAEGEGKETPYQWFVNFIDTNFTKQNPLFSEFATKGTAGDPSADAEQKIGEDIAARV